VRVRLPPVDGHAVQGFVRPGEAVEEEVVLVGEEPGDPGGRAEPGAAPDRPPVVGTGLDDRLRWDVARIGVRPRRQGLDRDAPDVEAHGEREDAFSP
jgi:hypothetical protein